MIINSIESPKLQFTVSNLDGALCLFRAVLGGKPFFSATLSQSNFEAGLAAHINECTLSNSKKTFIKNNIHHISENVNSYFYHKRSA